MRASLSALSSAWASSPRLGGRLPAADRASRRPKARAARAVALPAPPHIARDLQSPLLHRPQRPPPPQSPLQRLAVEHPHFSDPLDAYTRTFAALERSGQLRACPFPYGDERARHLRLLEAAVQDPKVHGLRPWLDMLRSKFGRGTPPHRRVLADINRTFLELQQALHLSRSMPAGHTVQVGCDYQRPGAGFDMQLQDARGSLHTQVEVTSVARPVQVSAQLHNAVVHIEEKTPRNGANPTGHWGAIGLTWAPGVDPGTVVRDLVEDLNRPHARLAQATLRLDDISLFAADRAQHTVLARVRKADGRWGAEVASAFSERADG